MEITMSDDWGGAVNRAAEAGIREMASDAEQALDALRPGYADRPIEEIKPAVAAAWARVMNGEITDPHLTEFAEAIRTGRGIEVRFDGLAA